jgi:hypothetical protein
MKPATPKARKLRAALAALVAAPGTPDEGKAAQKKLDRLNRRYDFTAPPAVSADDLFKGSFQPSRDAVPVATFTAGQGDIANSVKWAIENACRIPCLYSLAPIGGEGQGEGAIVLKAQATPGTACQLATIAGTITASFETLWTEYATAPGTAAADRYAFLMGLYEGMMNETRPLGAPLPPRASKPAKLKPDDFICRLPEELKNFSDFNRAVEKKFDQENGTVTWIRYYYNGKCIAQSAPDLNQVKLREAFYKLQGKSAKAMCRAPGVSIHPYTVAAQLGKSIRFNVPLPELRSQLASQVQPQLAGSPA